MKNTIYLILAILSMLLLGGCGGNTPFSPVLKGSSPDFTVSVQQITPTPVLTTTENEGLKRGGSPTNEVGFTVTATSVNGFRGTVNLSATSDQNSSLFTTSFTPTAITLNGSGSQTSTFTVVLQTTQSATARQGSNSYSWTITASAGSISHTAATHPTVQVSTATPTFTVTVQEPSPTPVIYTNVSASTTTVRGYVPPAVSIPVIVAPVNGFTGTVTLQTSSTASSLSTSFSSTTVALDGVHSQTVQFDVKNNSDVDAPPDTYNFPITGVSGGQTVHAATSASVFVTPPFTLSISPTTTQTIGDEEGLTAQWTITVTGIAGYTGTVEMSYNNPDTKDFSASFSNSNVPLTASQPTQTVTFKVTTLDLVNGSNGGTYTFGIGGFSLIFTNSVSATLTSEAG